MCTLPLQSSTATALLLLLLYCQFTELRALSFVSALVWSGLVLRHDHVHVLPPPPPPEPEPAPAQEARRVRVDPSKQTINAGPDHTKPRTPKKEDTYGLLSKDSFRSFHDGLVSHVPDK